MTCLAAECATTELGVGPYAFLCVPHALLVAEPVVPTCLACPEPVAAGRFAPAATLASVLCLGHALATMRLARGTDPPPPVPRVIDPAPAPFTALESRAMARRFRDEAHTDAQARVGRVVAPDPDARGADDLVRVGAVLEVLRSLGGGIVDTGPTYGTVAGYGCPWRPPKAVKPGEPAPPPREYDVGRAVDWASVDGHPETSRYRTDLGTRDPLAPPSRAETVDRADERVPGGARTMTKAAAANGWSHRLRAVTAAPPEGVPSVVLRAWRGPLLVVASWEAGKFASAWAIRSRDLPVRLGAREATSLLKSGP